MILFMYFNNLKHNAEYYYVLDCVSLQMQMNPSANQVIYNADNYL